MNDRNRIINEFGAVDYKNPVGQATETLILSIQKQAENLIKEHNLNPEEIIVFGSKIELAVTSVTSVEILRWGIKKREQARATHES